MYDLDEAVFWFMTDNDDVYNNYCSVCEFNDVTMVEFVLEYEIKRFYDYCGIKGWDYDHLVND